MTNKTTELPDPKQFWEIYQENDFVDAKDNQADWRVGLIIDKNYNNQLFKVRFDGWAAKYDEYFKFNSMKLQEFRSLIIGYTGQKKHAGIRSDWKFSMDNHQERMEKLKQFTAHYNEKNAREINQFIRGHNYFYTDFLMTKNYDSDENMTAIMEFFKLNIDYCIQYLDTIDPEFKQYYKSQEIPQLSHLIDSSSAMVNAFYQILDTTYIIVGGYPRLNVFFDNAQLLKDYIESDETSNIKKQYQQYMTKYFEEKGGFKTIDNLINKLQKSECIIPFLFLKCLVSLSKILHRDKKPEDNEWIEKFIQITIQNIDRLKDKNMKDLNKNDVSQLLESIKSFFSDDPDKKQKISNWALQIDVKLCKNMILCPFFDKKLKGVNNLIELSEKAKINVNTETFVAILLKSTVLDSLFILDNAEIIKRSADLCKNLFAMDTFPQKQIFKIWEMRLGKHEAALQEIYSLISTFPSCSLDDKFNIKLFQLISKCPVGEWDEDYIKMIKQYSLAAIGWSQCPQSVYGLQMLYEYLLIKKNDFAINCFIQVLDRLQKTSVAQKFTRDCFIKIGNNEESHIHVLIALRIIQQQIYSLKQIKFDFTQPVIQDILRHTDESEEIVQKKFELYSQVTKLTSTVMIFDQFINLWKEFKTKKGEKAFLNWIYKKKENGKGQINSKISSEIRNQIFESIWSNDYNFESMSQIEAEIFIEFFKSVNVLEGLIKKLNVIIKVQRLELLHIDKIWKALENSKNKRNIEMFADFIAEIYMSPGKSAEEERQQWVKVLVQKVSNKLRTAYKENKIDDIHKFLLILKQIIERDEENYTTKSGKYYLMKDYVVIQKSTKQQKTIRFNVKDSCYDFKKTVCQKFKIPFKRCRLYCKNEVIRYDNYFKNMLEASFTIGAPFQIEMINGELKSIKECLNSELDLFFELLGDERLERSVWQIISRLPIDRQFLSKIQNSEKPEESMNDPSIYKQLYMMRVMSLMKDKWWQHFLENNGLKNLVIKFDRIATGSKIQREYLKMLLERIDKCLMLSKQEKNINIEKLILDIFMSLENLYENLNQEEKPNLKKNSVEILITSTVFAICEKLMKQANILSVLMNQFPKLPQLLFKGFIKIDSKILRKQFATKLTILNNSVNDNQIQAYLQIILEKIFTKIDEVPQPEQTYQYFDYTANLIRGTKPQIFSKYLNETNPQLTTKIEAGLLNEKPEPNIEAINYLLVGYCMLMKELVKYKHEDYKFKICRFVLFQCFFSHLSGQSLQNKCKTKQSRRAALGLLAALLQGKNVSISLDLLSDLHKKALWRTRRYDDWMLTPGDKLKSVTGYVGLKNLGCTCYMNSFFQQIYMIPEFRQAIIQSQDPLEGKEAQNQNVLFQVKKMFYNLLHSERKFYVAQQFCHAFKNYEGEPTNVHEQMDIDEFSGNLFDRLENQMKGTKHQNVIKDFFGGVFSNQIICKGCPHFSETQESFLSVSLSVKNKKNIYQSFDTMIKGDTLDGDNAFLCQRCNKKVSAVKRVCLKKLPDHLLLTLKRFQFDFQTMAKMKINDFCQFPIELNVKEYSQQYIRRQENPDKFDQDEMLPDQYYDYVLKGVAIHLGYADSGHYYSFVNQRKPNGKWFEFNDTIVRPFDVRRLPEQAFGGETGSFETKVKIKNAYMLIYERKQKINNYTKYHEMNNEQLLKKQIYSKMSQEISQENVQQKIENILFSEEYSMFANQLLSRISKMNPENATISLKYIILVYLTVTIREKDQMASFHFLKKIHPFVLANPKICEWTVSVFAAQKSLLEFFKNNPASQVKKLLASWIIQLGRASRSEVQQILIDSILAYITLNHENLTDHCYILYELIKDPKLCQYAINKNIAGRILQNISRKNPSLFKSAQDLKYYESAQKQIGLQIEIPKTPYQLSKKLKPIVENQYVWAILYEIVQTAIVNNKQLQKTVSETEAEYMQLNYPKMTKLIHQCKKKFEINKLTKYLTYFAKNNQDITNQILLLISKGITEYQAKRLRQVFLLFSRIIEVKDDLRQYRNRKGLQYVVKALKENQKYSFDSNIIQQWIMKIVKKNSYLQKVLLTQKQILQYLIEVATKKIPTDDICRKNMVFQDNTVNKYHGIKMLKSTRKYIQLSRQIQKFYSELSMKSSKIAEWDSDEDLSDKEIQKGDIISYFDQKDAVGFIKVKVQDVFLNRIWISDGTKVISVWKDDQRLGTTDFVGDDESEQSSEDIIYSENTTQIDQDDSIDEI